MARSILLRLKAPTYLVESASALVAIHDGALPSDDAGILNMLNRYGAHLQRLCRLKLAVSCRPCPQCRSDAARTAGARF